MDIALLSQSNNPLSGNRDNHHHQETPSENRGSHQHENRAVSTTQLIESSFFEPSSSPGNHYLTAAVPNRIVHNPMCFQTLLCQLSVVDLESTAHCFKDRYEGRKHSRLAFQLKRFTLERKQKLSPTEVDQLLPLITSWGKSCNSWSCMSLTRTIVALATAGVFSASWDTEIFNRQVELAKVLLNVVAVKLNQLPVPEDIYTRGITGLQVPSLLWAMTKLVDNGLGQTQELKEAVAVLLPHVNTQIGHLMPPHYLAKLLRAVATLVDNGLELTQDLKEVVTALLPQVNAQRDHFKPQEITNLLWAVAKLVENGLEQTLELKEVMAALALLAIVNSQKDLLKHSGSPTCCGSCRSWCTAVWNRFWCCSKRPCCCLT